MMRVVSALLIGAVIAAGIMLALSLLIGGDWVSGNTHSDGAFVKDDTVSGPIVVSPIFLERCEDVVNRFTHLLESSRACKVDTDCSLANLGCPFGCNSAVNSAFLTELQESRRSGELERCAGCSCSRRSSPLGWEAVCRSGRCTAVEKSVADLKRTTRKWVSD